jgi:alpha-1,4-digalacturonate transport system permease protein
MIRAVQIFDEVFVLTGGGPGRPPPSSCSSSTRPASPSRSTCTAWPPPASLVLALGLMLLTVVQLRATNAGSAGERKR